MIEIIICFIFGVWVLSIPGIMFGRALGLDLIEDICALIFFGGAGLGIALFGICIILIPFGVWK